MCISEGLQEQDRQTVGMSFVYTYQKSQYSAYGDLCQNNRSNLICSDWLWKFSQSVALFQSLMSCLAIYTGSILNKTEPQIIQFRIQSLCSQQLNINSYSLVPCKQCSSYGAHEKPLKSNLFYLYYLPRQHFTFSSFSFKFFTYYFYFILYIY